MSHKLLPNPANALGWNNVNTTVRFSAVDDEDGSGVDMETLTGDVLVSTETAGQLVKGSAEDIAGNLGTDSVTVKIDKTNPTISATPSGTQGANGWYRSAVSVAFACADAGSVRSGVATCTGTQVLSRGDTVTGKAVVRADNEATTSVGPVKVGRAGDHARRRQGRRRVHARLRAGEDVHGDRRRALRAGGQLPADGHRRPAQRRRHV